MLFFYPKLVKKFEQKSARKSEGGNWWEISTKIGGIIVGKIIPKNDGKIVGKISGKIGRKFSRRIGEKSVEE